MIQIGLILGIFLMSVFSTRADIVKTETLTKGEKTVYLLHDTHVSTPNAKLQAAAIDQALKETPDVKFLIQQVEPITETDKKFSSCVDSFKGFVEKRIFSDTLPEEHDNDDKQYGIAPCLDSADPKKIYINQLENWISTSWNFHINEESLAEIVKNIDIKNNESDEMGL